MDSQLQEIFKGEITNLLDEFGTHIHLEGGIASISACVPYTLHDFDVVEEDAPTQAINDIFCHVEAFDPFHKSK